MPLISWEPKVSCWSLNSVLSGAGQQGSSQQNHGSSGCLDTIVVGNRNGTSCNSIPLMDPLFQCYPSKVCGFTQPYLRPFCMQHIFSMLTHKATQESGFQYFQYLGKYKNISLQKNLKQLQNCLLPKEELCGSEKCLVLVMVSLKINP